MQGKVRVVLSYTLSWSKTRAFPFLANLLILHTSARHFFPHKGPFLGLSCHHRELHKQLKCFFLEGCSVSTLICLWHRPPFPYCLVLVTMVSLLSD